MARDAAELKEVLQSVSDMLKPFYAQVNTLSQAMSNNAHFLPSTLQTCQNHICQFSLCRFDTTASSCVLDSASVVCF